MDKLILVVPKAPRRYGQKTTTPKISVDTGTYRKLQEVAAKTGMSLSAACRTLVQYAVENVQYVKE